MTRDQFLNALVDALDDLNTGAGGDPSFSDMVQVAVEVAAENGLLEEGP